MQRKNTGSIKKPSNYLQKHKVGLIFSGTTLTPDPAQEPAQKGSN